MQALAGFGLVRDAIEIEHRTHRLLPGFAAPDVEVPVEVEIFVAADAGNQLLLAANKARHLVERRPRVEYRELLAQVANRIERRKQLVAIEIDQV